MEFEYYMNEVLHHEWILTNKQGGYSMGCGNFINGRKYNGLLISSDDKLNRFHMVYSQEEMAQWRGMKMNLDSNSYTNCICPNGYEHILKSWLRPYPTNLYSSNPISKEFLIVKDIKMHKTLNITKVTFTNLSNDAVKFSIRPKFTLRNHHDLNHPGSWDKLKTEVKIDIDHGYFKRKDTNKSVFFNVSTGKLESESIIFRNVFYPVDASRGYDSVEDVISPVKWTFLLKQGEVAYIIYSDKLLDSYESVSNDIDRRYQKLTLPFDHPYNKKKFSFSNIMLNNEKLYKLNDYKKILTQMYEDFITTNDIIAGYPWFSSWGRDTMISMQPLLYDKRKVKLYIRILDKYGKNIRNGIIPNIIGENNEGTNYDTIDASLWFVVRIFNVYDLVDDIKIRKRLFSYVTKVVENYLFNKLLPFFVDDEDGLLSIIKNYHALTWMDAKVYGRPVTPRFGKCVEINALWFNALQTFVYIADNLRINTFQLKKLSFKLSYLKNMIKKMKIAANKFIVNDHLADRIEDNNPIDEHRPNALIAISLPFKLWKKKIQENVWNDSFKELYTFYGLRSLSPKHNAFKKKYIGDQIQLDLAYHQGTVWAWLLGPFLQSYYYIFKNKLSKRRLKEDIESFINHFKDGILRGHIASIAEVWDGNQPHFPKGCPAQAWSVTALIEAEHILSVIEEEK